MIVKLSDKVFTATSHVKWGPHVDEPGKVADGLLPTESLNITFPEMDWNDWPKPPKCSGPSRVSFCLNGIDREVYICSSVLNYEQIGSHGDAYAKIVNGTWSALDDEPDIDLSWGRKDYYPKNLCEFEENVMSWGYGSEMTNHIPTSRFIELVLMGRGLGQRDWIEFACAVLNAIDIEPTSDPLQKAAKAFQSTKNIAALLKVLSNEKTKSRTTQAKNFREWKRQIRSTSITC